MGFHHVPTVCGCQFPGILPVVASLPSGGTRSDGCVMLRLQPSCKSVKSCGTTLQIYINSWISASFLPIKRCILVAFRDFCFFEESKCFVCRCGPSRFITSFFIMESRVESLLSRQVVPVFCRQGLFGDSFQILCDARLPANVLPASVRQFVALALTFLWLKRRNDRCVCV